MTRGTEDHRGDGTEQGGPFGGGELVEVPSLGASGSFEPRGERQKYDLIVFYKNHPPRDAHRRPVFGVRAEDHSPVCASPKRKGGYCCDEARMANGRCRRHGGNARRGIAHPNYDHGSDSKYQMPANLLHRYRDYLKDPELTHHRTSIAQIDALINELWKDYEEGAGPELWRELNRVYDRLVVSERANDRQKSRELFAELGYVLKEGRKHSGASERIIQHLAERRKQADAETRRKLSEAMVYSVEEAYVFYTSLGAAVRKHVKDEKIQSAILNDIYAIAGDSGVGNAT